MATKTTTYRSVTEATEILAGLKSQMAGKEDILTRGNDRRRKFAYAASQGDKAAAASLEQIVADETAASEAIRNLKLAIEEATRERAAAVERGHAADLKRREKILSRESDDLIAADQEVVKIITALHAALDKRAEKIQRIVEIGLLPAGTISALENRTSIDAAIVGGLGRHFPPFVAVGTRSHALGDMVSRDCQLLNKPSTVAKRELTPVERELQRHARRSMTGYPDTMTG